MKSLVILMVCLLNLCSSVPLQPRSLPVSVYDYYEFYEIPRHLQAPDAPQDQTSSATTYKKSRQPIKPSAPFINQPDINGKVKRPQKGIDYSQSSIDRSHTAYKQYNPKPNDRSSLYRSNPQPYYKKPSSSKYPQKYYPSDDDRYNIPEDQNERPILRSENKNYKPVVIQKGNKYYQIEDPVYLEDEFIQPSKQYYNKPEYKYPLYSQSSDDTKQSVYKKKVVDLPIQNEDHKYNNQQSEVKYQPKYPYDTQDKYEPKEYQYYDDALHYDFDQPAKSEPVKKETVQYDEYDPYLNYDYYDDVESKANEEYKNEDIYQYQPRPDDKQQKFNEHVYDDYQVPEEKIKEKRQAHHYGGDHFDANGHEFVSKAKEVEHKKGPGRLAFQIHGQKGPHSYRFGYDTGKGHNRQFRYEERDNDGQVHGRYGFYDKHGKLQVVNYSAHPKHGFSADVPHP